MTMNKSVRPSLYSGTSSGNTADAFNILGVLEPPRRPGSLLRRVASVLLAILVSTGVFVAANNFPELRSHAIVVVDSVFSRQEAPVQTTTASATPVLAIAESRDGQAGVAKIVSEEPADLQVPGSLDLAAQANIGLPAPSPMPELAAKAIMDGGGPSSPAAVNASVDRQPAAAQRVAEAPANKLAPPEKARTVQTARHATPKSRQPHRAAARRKDDRDVDLIAALLTRVSAADTAGKSAKSAGAPKGRNASAAPKNSSVADSSVKPNRDLVLNQAHESLSTLVRRCRTLGLVEGELCRLRICSGSWGKDPACPASGLPPEN